jgi:hypothetical protein
MPELWILFAVCESRTDLIPLARECWERFVTMIAPPITVTRVEYDVTDEAANGVAFVRPYFGLAGSVLGDWAKGLLSVRLLTNTDVEDCNLTFLHESIHLSFAFGEHRERWQRLQSEIRRVEFELQTSLTTAPQRLDFLFYRHSVACFLRNLPAEIVAEQRLKRQYPDLFPRRVRQYLRAREGREQEIREGRANDCLWPFSVFYEVLRISFYIPLVTDDTESVTELRRLEAVVTTELSRTAGTALSEALLTEVSQLLAVHDDQPLAAAEEAYDRLFNRVMATEPSTAA